MYLPAHSLHTYIRTCYSEGGTRTMPERTVYIFTYDGTSCYASADGKEVKATCARALGHPERIANQAGPTCRDLRRGFVHLNAPPSSYLTLTVERALTYKTANHDRCLGTSQAGRAGRAGPVEATSARPRARTVRPTFRLSFPGIGKLGATIFTWKPNVIEMRTSNASDLGAARKDPSRASIKPEHFE